MLSEPHGTSVRRCGLRKTTLTAQNPMDFGLAIDRLRAFCAVVHHGLPTVVKHLAKLRVHLPPMVFAPSEEEEEYHDGGCYMK